MHPFVTHTQRVKLVSGLIFAKYLEVLETPTDPLLVRRQAVSAGSMHISCYGKYVLNQKYCQHGTTAKSSCTDSEMLSSIYSNLVSTMKEIQIGSGLSINGKYRKALWFMGLLLINHTIVFNPVWEKLLWKSYEEPNNKMSCICESISEWRLITSFCCKTFAKVNQICYTPRTVLIFLNVCSINLLLRSIYRIETYLCCL